MGMKKSSANMYGSRAMKKAIRDCIAKTSSWGCSKVRMPAIHKRHEPPPRQTGGAMAVRQRGFDTSQLARGESFRTICRGGYVTAVYKRPTVTTTRHRRAPRGASLLAMMPGLHWPPHRCRAPQLSPCSQAILASAYAPYDKQEGTLAELFSNTDLGGAWLRRPSG